MTLAKKKVDMDTGETFAQAMHDFVAVTDGQVELAQTMSDTAAGEMGEVFEKLLENLAALTDSAREIQSHRDRLLHRLEAEEKERAQRVFYANDIIVDELVDKTEGLITQLMMHGQSQDAIFQILTCVRGLVTSLAKLDAHEIASSDEGAATPRRLADEGKALFVMHAQHESYAKVLGLAVEEDDDGMDMF